MIIRATKRRKDVVLLVNRRTSDRWTFPEGTGRLDEIPEETIVRVASFFVDVPLVIKGYLGSQQEEGDLLVHYYLCTITRKDASSVRIRGKNIQWKSLAEALELESELDRAAMAEAGKISM